MRISAKGRYALASMIVMAQHYTSGEYITVISISERLGISKIYLEQVFSLLKRGGLVTSVKGAQGGYQLMRMPQQITLLDIMRSVEMSLFETAEETVTAKAPEIEAAMKASAFEPLDRAIQTVWQNTTLYDLVNEAEKHKANDELMFFI
jgi:Rrf2 family protein